MTDLGFEDNSDWIFFVKICTAAQSSHKDKQPVKGGVKQSGGSEEKEGQRSNLTPGRGNLTPEQIAAFDAKYKKLLDPKVVANVGKRTPSSLAQGSTPGSSGASAGVVLSPSRPENLGGFGSNCTIHWYA